MGSNQFVDHVVDLLDCALDGDVRARAMFGGHGIYHRGIMMALVAWERLYFKADDITRPRFEAAGSEPFVYDDGKGKSVTMSYWEAPEGTLDSPDSLRPWAVLGFEAGLRNQARKKPGRAGTAKAE